jgi:hypothetical protein
MFSVCTSGQSSGHWPFTGAPQSKLTAEICSHAAELDAVDEDTPADEFTAEEEPPVDDVFADELLPDVADEETPDELLPDVVELEAPPQGTVMFWVGAVLLEPTGSIVLAETVTDTEPAPVPPLPQPMTMLCALLPTAMVPGRTQCAFVGLLAGLPSAVVIAMSPALNASNVTLDAALGPRLSSEMLQVTVEPPAAQFTVTFKSAEPPAVDELLLALLEDEEELPFGPFVPPQTSLHRAVASEASSPGSMVTNAPSAFPSLISSVSHWEIVWLATQESGVPYALQHATGGSKLEDELPPPACPRKSPCI